MTRSVEGSKRLQASATAFFNRHMPASSRDAVLREIQQLMDRWQLTPEELVDPVERQAALGKARRLVEFWQITAEELDAPPSALAEPRPYYRYTHPGTGETWDGSGSQPEWLRRCLLTEGYRLDQVRTTVSMN